MVMSLVMDGVRGGGVVRARAKTRKPSVHARTSKRPAQVAAAELRLSVGLDGVRGQVAPERRPQLAQPADLPIVEQQPLAQPAVLAQAEVLPQAQIQAGPPRRWQWVQNWQRPALAAGFVMATLTVSVLTVRVMAPPRSTTARAEAVIPHSATAPAGSQHQKTRLQDLVNSFAVGGGTNFGIIVKNLKTGEIAALNQDQEMESASLYKLFVAQRIYQRIDLGQLAYTQPVGGDSGQNVAQCLSVMISISDNVCGRALGDMLGWGAQDQALAAEGFANTDLASPQQTTAADVATLMERLYRGTQLSKDSTQRFMGLLKDQRVNNRLPMGLPVGTAIAHKTGDLDNFVHDAGIVYGPQTDYLVVVMSGPWSDPTAAPADFTDLSQQLWNYFEE
jgi:beta-lactamase class A